MALSYTLEPGHPWERLIMVKDSRTRRPRKVASGARASFRHQITNEIYEPEVTISYEGGILLSVSYSDSLELTAGTWDFDVVGDIRGYQEKLAEGTIEVAAASNITVLEGGPVMYINYNQYTDFRKIFTWYDASGAVLDIADARLQAQDSLNNVVMDLKFYETAPTDVAIQALPAIERGYLINTEDEATSLEMHISDLHTIAAGEYSFDLLAQEVDGDWAKLGSGTLNVVASITDPNL